MKQLLFFAVIVLWGCGAAPEPLQYGKDACYTCKMTLMDKKFGAEIVTGKGKVYKFDDVNCMVNFYHTGYEPVENLAYTMVVDFSNPGYLVDASSAQFVQSDEIGSPMGSQVAAFEKKETLEEYNKTWNGVLLAWPEVSARFK